MIDKSESLKDSRPSQTRHINNTSIANIIANSYLILMINYVSCLASCNHVRMQLQIMKFTDGSCLGFK